MERFVCGSAPKADQQLVVVFLISEKGKRVRTGFAFHETSRRRPPHLTLLLPRDVEDEVIGIEAAET